MKTNNHSGRLPGYWQLSHHAAREN